MNDKTDNRKLVRVDQIMHLYARFPIAATATIILSSMLLIVQRPVIDFSILFSWWVTLVVITFLRLLLVFRFRKAKELTADVEIWATRFLAGSVSAGLAWGAAGFLLFPDQGLVHQLIVIFTISGLSSAAVTTLGADWDNISASLCTMLAPLILRFLLLNSPIYIVMAVMTLIYLIMLLIIARNMHNTILEIFNLRTIDIRQQARLLESEEKYRNVVERSNDGIGIIQDGLVKYANEPLATMAGYTVAEITGTFFFDYIHPDELPLVADRYRKCLLEEEVPAIYETVGKHRCGRNIPMELNVGLIPYHNKPAELVIVRDITGRKQAEKRIKDALKEKEVLLKEIHHRVKNNLQIISSLLSLQANYSRDSRVLQIFRNSQERIRAMAIAHEKLYQSKDLAKIDFRDYIGSLTTYLFESYSSIPGKVRLKIQVDDVFMNIETAIPLGLIINELVSNSLKYAFPGNREGDIRVQLKKERDKNFDYLLVIRDNGVGLPEDINFEEDGSLGMVLVNTLVKQLHGIIGYETKNGAGFKVKFKKIKH